MTDSTRTAEFRRTETYAVSGGKLQDVREATPKPEHVSVSTVEAVGLLPVTLSFRPIADTDKTIDELLIALRRQFSEIKKVKSAVDAEAASTQYDKIEQATKETFDALHRAMEAAQKAKSGNIFDKIGAALAVAFGAIFAAIAVVGSGGALTAPVAVTMTLLLASVVQFASTISKDQGGPEFSLNKGMIEGMQELAEKFVSKEDAEKLGKLLAGAIGVGLIVPALVDPALAGSLLSGAAAVSGEGEKVQMILNMVGTLVAGIAAAVVGGAAMSKAAENSVRGAKDAASMSETMSKIFNMRNGQIASGLTQGGIGAYRSAENIQNAQVQRDADDMQADTMDMHGFLDVLKSEFEQTVDHQESFGKIIAEVLRTLKEAGQSVAENRMRMIRSMAPEPDAA